MIEIEGDSKALFSLATTPGCKEWRYSFPRIAPLYSWSLSYNAECSTGKHQVPFFESLVWLDLGLNQGLPDQVDTTLSYNELFTNITSEILQSSVSLHLLNVFRTQKNCVKLFTNLNWIPSASYFHDNHSVFSGLANIDEFVLHINCWSPTARVGWLTQGQGSIKSLRNVFEVTIIFFHLTPNGTFSWFIYDVTIFMEYKEGFMESVCSH